MRLRRDDLGDLMAFLVVAEEQSFTRAAVRLGTSQSALSHVIRRLEERLSLRLLTRTTRSVVPTEAGSQLAATLAPSFGAIEGQLADLDEQRGIVSGTLRVTCSRRAAQTLLRPVCARLMAEHPALDFEIIADQRLVDIVRDGFDAGVRLGEEVEKDMIAVRISPQMRMVVAASPAYFARTPPPEHPEDLTAHDCLNLRLPTSGGLYAWEFERDGRTLNVRVSGRFASNDPELLIEAALAGEGLVCLPSDHLDDHVAAGRLQRCLGAWCPPFPGYYLYYPSRHQNRLAFRVFAEALRYRGPDLGAEA